MKKWREIAFYAIVLCVILMLYVGFVIFTKLDVECFMGNGMQHCDLRDILSWDNFKIAYPKFIIAIIIVSVFYFLKSKR